MEAGPHRPLMIVAAVLAALGAGALLLVALTEPDAPQPQPTAAVTGRASAPVAVGARFAKAGDCLTNDGTEAEPVLRLVSCAPGAYTVLKRVEGVTDADRACAAVPGYEYNYSYDSPLDSSLDFVLCLRTS